MSFKCHFCQECKGLGCVGEMPGMGGPDGSRNFIHNYQGWDKIPCGSIKEFLPQLRLAPMTGAVENVGYCDEKTFYFDLVKMCLDMGVKLSIGDGTPDEKLLNGIEAVKSAQAKAAVFIKPYPDDRFYERMEWALPVSEFCGLDIDSYNIVTMRNLVHLEKKTPLQLKKIKEYLNSKGIPFVIKGIFTPEDVEMVREVRPDAAYISNHGGRVSTLEGSTAEFLAENASVLKSYSGQLWVDGGIRSENHMKKASTYGADCVLMGRPFATKLCSMKS